MKFDRNKAKTPSSRDPDGYRKFLAGNKLAYAQAFWENGPREKSKTVTPEGAAKLLPGVRNTLN